MDISSILALERWKQSLGDISQESTVALLEDCFSADDSFDLTDATPEEVITIGEDQLFETSDWTRKLAAEEMDADGMFTNAVNSLENALEGVPEIEVRHLPREVFASLYGMDPKLPETERRSWMQELHDKAEELPEWRKMKRMAAGDSWACGIASAAIIGALEEAIRMKQPEEKIEDFIKRDIFMAVLEASLINSSATATEEIQGLELAMGGFGCGKGEASSSEVNRHRQKLKETLLNNETMMRVARLAGRFEIAANTYRRSDAGKQREEVSGVTFGSDFSLLLPQFRSMPRELLIKRYKDNQLPQWRIQGGEKEKGPIVIVIDESGSMDRGNEVRRIDMAKALLLVLMNTCIIEKRPFAFVRFAAQDPIVKVFKQPEIVKLEELESHLTTMIGGGTNTLGAMSVAAQLAAQLGKEADIVLVTDGADTWSKDSFQGDAKVHGIAIGCEFNESQIEMLSSYVELLDVDLDNAEAKIGVVLGL